MPFLDSPIFSMFSQVNDTTAVIVAQTGAQVGLDGQLSVAAAQAQTIYQHADIWSDYWQTSSESSNRPQKVPE